MKWIFFRILLAIFIIVTCVGCRQVINLNHNETRQVNIDNQTKHQYSSAESVDSKSDKINRISLPLGFEFGFIIPNTEKDQRGNPVTIRNNRKFDPDTGFAYEIWLYEPRIEFVFIPAGTFIMGSSITGEDISRTQFPSHRVCFFYPLFISKYEITQSQWESIMDDNPSIFKESGMDAPVDFVSWVDCQEFVRKLNDMIFNRSKWSRKQPIRLPTEAEWEYACRAGKYNEICSGLLTYLIENNSPELDSFAFFRANSGVTYKSYVKLSDLPGEQDNNTRIGPHSVGLKQPNVWNLYDMIGNVYEWCEDSFKPDYKNAPLDGSTWIRDEKESIRIMRGGSFASRSEFCRSAHRWWDSKFCHAGDVGLRLVISLEESIKMAAITGKQ